MGGSQEQTNPAKGFFPIYQHSPQLNESDAAKCVKFARRRIQKSNILDYTNDFNQTCSRTLTHSQIDLGEMLGQGSFSSVYAIKYIRDDGKNEHEADKLVVKVLRPKLTRKHSLLGACIADISIEAMLLSKLNHENIISLKATSPGTVSIYSNGRHDAFFLVMEKLTGTLAKTIKRWRKQRRKITFGFKHTKITNARILEEQIRTIFQLVSALEYLQSQNILHRDLKPANIGFDGNGVLKVFDFDVAKVLPRSSNADKLFRLTRRIGSARYMAPEIAKGQKYNLKADVYTFAVLCHEIISLKKPYATIPSDKHDQAVFYEHQRPHIPDSWPEGFNLLLNQSWNADVFVRPTMKEAGDMLRTELKQMMFESKENIKNPLTLMRQRDLTQLLSDSKGILKRPWSAKDIRSQPIPLVIV